MLDVDEEKSIPAFETGSAPKVGFESLAAGDIGENFLVEKRHGIALDVSGDIREGTDRRTPRRRSITIP
jgi:hypothetical protein